MRNLSLSLLSVLILGCVIACAPSPPVTPTLTGTPWCTRPPVPTFTAYPTYTPYPTLDPWLATRYAPLPDNALCRAQAIVSMPYYENADLIVLLGALTAGELVLIDHTLPGDRFHIMGRGWAMGTYRMWHSHPGCLLWVPTPGPTPTPEAWLWATTNTRLNVRNEPCVLADDCFVTLTLPTGYRIGLDRGRRRLADGFEWYWMASCAGGAEGWVAVGAMGGEQYVVFD